MNLENVNEAAAFLINKEISWFNIDQIYEKDDKSVP